MMGSTATRTVQDGAMQDERDQARGDRGRPAEPVRSRPFRTVLRARAEFEKRRTTVAGVRIVSRACERAGPERPTVVLVHGLIVSGMYLMPVAELLARDFNVHVPDLPGFGDSDKPSQSFDVPAMADWLLAWMDAVGLQRPALLGNSLGCQYIADLAARHPNRVDRLVLVSPTVDMNARAGWVQVLRWLRTGRHDRLSLIALHVRDLACCGLRRGWKTFRYMLHDRIETKLPRVRVPSLVVRGANDPIVSQRWAEQAAELLPRGELRVIAGAGHTINYGSALELACVTAPFLEHAAPRELHPGTALCS